MNAKSFFLNTTLCLLSTIGFVNASDSKTLLVWGDSLSAAYGIPVEKGWVELLKPRLDELNIQLRNSSVSGETTRGGLTRLPTALRKFRPAIVIIELGANDGLRGIATKEIQKNLLQMVTLAKEAGAEVLILGMQIPPNYGTAYTRQFSATFEVVAKQTETTLAPFFLEGVATDYDLMQTDGVHPTAEAQPKILENIWPSLEPILQRLVRQDIPVAGRFPG